MMYYSPTMPTRPIKNRLVPYKIMVCLLYGEYTWLSRASDDPSSLSLRLGPMSRFLRVSSSRLREHLDWLSTRRYLASLSVKYGEAVVTIRPPLATLPHPPAGGPPTQEYHASL
jgi:hypothetical protein